MRGEARSGADQYTIEWLRDVTRLHFYLNQEIGAARRIGSPQAKLFVPLLAKINASLDNREKNRVEPDLQLIVAPLRMFVPAVFAQMRGAIIAGQCLEFDYLREEAGMAHWREIVVVELTHSSTPYHFDQTLAALVVA